MITLMTEITSLNIIITTKTSFIITVFSIREFVTSPAVCDAVDDTIHRTATPTMFKQTVVVVFNIKPCRREITK